jgi:Ran GTPase-activating protein (RanGAP) involved in mRNA processing and transport
LNRNKLNDNNILLISEALIKNNSLMSLHLCGNNLTSNGLIYLSKALKINEKLEQILLGENNFTTQGLAELVDTLILKNRTIKYLNLSKNLFKLDDLNLICNLIKTNKDIYFLDLSSIAFNSESISYLSKALAKNIGLKVLFLEDINLNSNMLSAFVSSFQLSQLTELHLSQNIISERGSIFVSNLVKENKKLKVLALKSCSLSPYTVSSIISSLPGSSIEKLDLRDNPLAFNNDSINLMLKLQKNTSIFLLKTDLGEKEELFKNNAKFNLY